MIEEDKQGFEMRIAERASVIERREAKMRAKHGKVIKEYEEIKEREEMAKSLKIEIKLVDDEIELKS